MSQMTVLKFMFKMKPTALFERQKPIYRSHPNPRLKIKMPMTRCIYECELVEYSKFYGYDIVKYIYCSKKGGGIYYFSHDKSKNVARCNGCPFKVKPMLIPDKKQKSLEDYILI